jgi:hypothetical protein
MQVFMWVKQIAPLFAIAKDLKMLQVAKLKIPPMQKYIVTSFGVTAPASSFSICRLFQKEAGHVKAHDNNIHDNNERNFAKAGSFGTTWGVGNAAPGSGVIVLAASDIEIYNNQIINNNSGAILLASGLVTDDSALNKINDNYFPISKNIFIHDNTMQMA